MTSSQQTAAPGWYWAAGDPEGTVRYWDGATWNGAPQAVLTPATPTSVADRRGEIRQEQLRRANVRLGEGIPFHQLYMRTRRRKGNWL